MTPLIANWRLYLDGVLLGESKYRYEADHAQQYFCVISKNTAVAPKMTLNPPSLCLSRHFRLSRNRDLTHNPLWRVLSVMAFHEKAGRSQGNSGFIVSFFIFAEKTSFPPSSHCRHASIRTLEERIISLGACGASSIQPVLPSVWRPLVALKSATWPRP